MNVFDDDDDDGGDGDGATPLAAAKSHIDHLLATHGTTGERKNVSQHQSLEGNHGPMVAFESPDGHLTIRTNLGKKIS